jgi:hypothetical protein
MWSQIDMQTTYDVRKEAEAVLEQLKESKQ